MATINFTVQDHSIRADNLVELAQASNNFDTCAFTFDESWDGFTLYAVMYQDPKNVFKKPLDSSNTCKIPEDALKKSGYLYIGARGEKADKTIATSVLFKTRVSNGAIDGNETSQEILNESQYEYLLGKINKLSDEVQKIEVEGLTVDSVLSETSTNAIQNKAVAKAIGELKGDIEQLKQNGTGGTDGKSAYQIASDNGFVGTEEEWIASLKGEDGHTPVKGVDYFTQADKTELVNSVLDSLQSAEGVSF